MPHWINLCHEGVRMVEPAGANATHHRVRDLKNFTALPRGLTLFICCNACY
jgi:hypothetical protein